jgi:hypothetical protein
LPVGNRPARHDGHAPTAGKPRTGGAFVLQGRQDSNLQPPVLETGALPVELRPSVRGSDCTRGLAGIRSGVSEHADQFEDRDDEREAFDPEPPGDDEEEVEPADEEYPARLR